VLFQDYFNSPSDSNWTFYNRDGRIADGRLWIDGGYKPDAVDRGGWALTHVGDQTWRDYTYDVFYDNETWEPMSTVYFRVAAQTPGAQPTTMYRVEMFAPGSSVATAACGGDGSGGVVGISKFVDGQFYAGLPYTCKSNTVVGTNQLRIVVQGNHFDMFSNGQLVNSYTDPSPIRYGGVGVGQTWETNGWFDNVTVSRVGDHDGNSQ
jgi:hypothetical protein